jgi:hypothetical protein
MFFSAFTHKIDWSTHKSQLKLGLRDVSVFKKTVAQGHFSRIYAIIRSLNIKYLSLKPIIKILLLAA